jgi:predicted enzyme related to lactoylglutathione lyase
MTYAFDSPSEIMSMPCPECGGTYQMVRSMLTRNGVFEVVVYTSMHDHGSPSLTFDVIFGTWGTDGHTDHVTLGAELTWPQGASEPAGEYTNAAEPFADSPVWGHRVSAAEAPNHPLRHDLWEVVEFILDHEDEVARHIYGQHVGTRSPSAAEPAPVTGSEPAEPAPDPRKVTDPQEATDPRKVTDPSEPSVEAATSSLFEMEALETPESVSDEPDDEPDPGAAEPDLDWSDDWEVNPPSLSEEESDAHAAAHAAAVGDGDSPAVEGVAVTGETPLPMVSAGGIVAAEGTPAAGSPVELDFGDDVDLSDNPDDPVHIPNEIGQPSYLELGVPDAISAIAFYSELLDWNYQGNEVLTNTLRIGIHGEDASAHFEPFFDVADLETALVRLISLGGTQLAPVQDSGTFGLWVQCMDNQGVRFALRQRD